MSAEMTPEEAARFEAELEAAQAADAIGIMGMDDEIMLRAALDLAEGRSPFGKPVSVFPCKPNGKNPLGSLVLNGYLDATTDPATIREWWTKCPDANIGVPMLPNGFFALDVDVKRGARGLESVTALTQQNGSLGTTLQSETPSGGQHYVYVATDPRLTNSASTIGPGLDTRANGYICVAPSTVDGKPYRWTVLCSPAPMPDWLLMLVLEPPKASGKASSPGFTMPSEIREGEGRNDALYRLTRSQQKRGISQGAAWACIVAENQAKCKPPLPDDELRKMFDGAWKQPDRPEFGQAPEDDEPIEEPGDPYMADDPYAAATEDAQKYLGLLTLPLTDAGNAERLAQVYGDIIRWVPEGQDGGEWLAWDGTRWVPESTDRVRAYMLQTIRLTLQTAAVAQGLNNRRKLIKFLLKSESASAINAAVKAARYIAGQPFTVARSEFDRDPFVLNCQNATVDLRTGTSYPHRREDMLTQITPFPYEPAATCPRWLQALDETFAGMPEVVAYLRRALGYSLTGSIQEQVLFLMLGPGDNGKSTVMDTATGALGPGYSMKIPSETLLALPKHADQRERATPAMVAMRGRRIGVVNEIMEGRFLDEPRIKSLTGMARETGRQLYSAQTEWLNTITLWFDVNTLPRFQGVDFGIARRMQVIPFTQRIAPERKVKDLSAILLQDEGPGILAWLVNGCLEWQRDGLQPPAAVVEATRTYTDSQNHLPRFFADHYVTDPRAWVAKFDVQTHYSNWATQEEIAPVSPALFRRFMTGVMGLRDGRVGHEGTRAWIGMRLKNVEEVQRG